MWFNSEARGQLHEFLILWNWIPFTCTVHWGHDVRDHVPSEPSQCHLGLGKQRLLFVKMAAGVAGSWYGHETLEVGTRAQVKAGRLEEMHPSVWQMAKEMSHFPGTGNLMLPSTKFTLRIDCSIIFKNSQTWWRMLLIPGWDKTAWRQSLKPVGRTRWGGRSKQGEGTGDSSPSWPLWVYRGKGALLSHGSFRASQWD